MKHNKELVLGKKPADIHRHMIHDQFNLVFEPCWFGTVQWLPFIFSEVEAVKETKHFKNKLMLLLSNVSRPKKIPNPPHRPSIIFFHERQDVCINPKSKSPKFRLVYHTHFHLGQCPEEYNSLVNLEWLIKEKVAHKFNRFSRANSKFNKGFVLLPWEEGRHKDYNFKDYYRFAADPDADLVLDPFNSDLKFTRN